MAMKNFSSSPARIGKLAGPSLPRGTSSTVPRVRGGAGLGKVRVSMAPKKTNVKVALPRIGLGRGLMNRF